MTAAKTYTAPHPVYVNGLLTPEGEQFTTSAVKGALWEEVPASPEVSDKGPLDLSVAALADHLAGLSDLATLEALLSAEKDGKTRKGAVDAIQGRIDELLA